MKRSKDLDKAILAPKFLADLSILDIEEHSENTMLLIKDHKCSLKGAGMLELLKWMELVYGEVNDWDYYIDASGIYPSDTFVFMLKKHKDFSSIEKLDISFKK